MESQFVRTAAEPWEVALPHTPAQARTSRTPEQKNLATGQEILTVFYPKVREVDTFAPRNTHTVYSDSVCVTL